MSQQGRRAYLDDQGRLRLAEGEYGRDAAGLWWARPPGCHMGELSASHTVVEHEDGTITVEPSILVDPVGQSGGGWHGFLVHGEWRGL